MISVIRSWHWWWWWKWNVSTKHVSVTTDWASICDMLRLFVIIIILIIAPRAYTCLIDHSLLPHTNSHDKDGSLLYNKIFLSLYAMTDPLFRSVENPCWRRFLMVAVDGFGKVTQLGRVLVEFNKLYAYEVHIMSTHEITVINRTALRALHY